MAVKICPVEDIKPGRAIKVTIDGHAIAIARTKTGDVRAIDDKCSHGEISLSEGFVDDSSIECWAHGAKFDLGSGKPLSLPAYEPVAVFETFVEDGVIYLEYPPA